MAPNQVNNNSALSTPTRWGANDDKTGTLCEFSGSFYECSTLYQGMSSKQL